MAKSISLFFGGIVLCFVMIKALGNTETQPVKDDSKLQAKIDQLSKSDKALRDQIASLKKSLKNQLSAPSKVVKSSAAAVDMTAVKKLIKDSVAAEVKTQMADTGKNQLADALGNVDEKKLVESVASNFQEIMAKRVKNSLLKDIDLTESQTAELDVIFTEYQTNMSGMREKIEERITEDTTRDERREIWREEMTKLRTESNEKVKNVMNDEAKYAQYEKNTQNAFGGWGGGRGRGGR